MFHVKRLVKDSMAFDKNHFSNEMTVRDYSVSGESFKLVYDEKLKLYKTTPQPSKRALSQYYKSENYISHTDRKANLLEKVYHIARSVSLRRKLNLIEKHSNDTKRLLDFGCGTGDFLKVAQDNGWKVKGIEPNVSARTIANEKINNEVFGSEEFWGLPENYYDMITLWHVLEHIPNLEKHISQLKKILKPSGSLIIAVPNYKSYDAQYYNLHWAAFDVPRHLWHFSKLSIKKIFQQHELEVERILPMKLDSYYVSLLSEKYKNGWMNPAKAFYIGFLSNLKAKRNKEYSSLIYIIKNQNRPK